MIVDTTIFFDELDILEMRLSIMGDHVDRFVIVESDHSYMNVKKDHYVLEKNWERFANWHNKIHYIQSRSNLRENPWENDADCRREFIKGWHDVKDNDIILYSDVDEIFRPSAIEYANSTNYDYYGMIMPVSFYKFNYVDVLSDKIGYVAWGGAFKGKLKKLDPVIMRKFRQFENLNFVYVHHAGWHFSWIGKTEDLNHKLDNLCHQEVNNSSVRSRLVSLEDLMSSHIDHLGDGRAKWRVVKLDDYFPDYLVKNKDKYSDYIVPDNLSFGVRHYYPFEILEHAK